MRNSKSLNMLCCVDCISTCRRSQVWACFKRKRNTAFTITISSSSSSSSCVFFWSADAILSCQSRGSISEERLPTSATTEEVVHCIPHRVVRLYFVHPAPSDPFFRRFILILFQSLLKELRQPNRLTWKCCRQTSIKMAHICFILVHNHSMKMEWIDWRVIFKNICRLILGILIFLTS